MPTETLIPSLLADRRQELLDDWLRRQGEAAQPYGELLDAEQLAADCAAFLDLLAAAIRTDGLERRDTPQWDGLHAMLAELSRNRAMLGFSPSETATFVFSFKETLFDALRRDRPQGTDLADDIWQASTLLDELGLLTVEGFLHGRDELIRRQQQEMLELSTPVVSLWDGVLALPLIGTLDSARTQVVMENLLESIDATGASVAIMDITGVPTVDTLVAQHLIKTAAAARLMGADVIISGVRPQIAQTIVQLGVELPDVTTKASLADAFKLALAEGGWRVTRES